MNEHYSPFSQAKTQTLQTHLSIWTVLQEVISIWSIFHLRGSPTHYYVVFNYAWFSCLVLPMMSSKIRCFPHYESKLLESARFKPTNVCFWLNPFLSNPTKPLFVIPIPITLPICIIITLTPPGSNYTAHERSGVLGRLQPTGGAGERHLCLKTRAEAVTPSRPRGCP